MNHDSLFRHSAQEGLRVGPLLDLLATAADSGDSTGGDSSGNSSSGGDSSGSDSSGTSDAADLRYPPSAGPRRR